MIFSKLLGRSTAALIAFGLLCSINPANARGRAPEWRETAFQAKPLAYARPHLRLHEGSGDLVAVAEQHLGQGNFTGLPGAWCAWAVSAWLRATGHAPLASGMAASALAYGPLELHPKRGDLVVLGHGRHVGIVVADLGSQIEMVSGNWGHAVRRAIVSKRGLVFVRV